MSVFANLVAKDILGPIIEPMLRGGFELLSASKEFPLGCIRTVLTITPARPWVDSKGDPERCCLLWKDVYFKYYKIIPKGCRNCWKVFLKMEKISDAFRVLEMQRKEPSISKVGIERRPQSGNVGAYLGVWYAAQDAGLKGARELHAEVKKAVRKEFKGRLHPVLKRGCTEIEWRFPQSDHWDELAQEGGWDAVEEGLDKVFERPEYLEQSEIMKVAVLVQLIRFAVEYGDESYKELADGDLGPTMVTYNDSVHSIIDYPVPKNGTVEVGDGKDSDGHKRGEGEKGSLLTIDFGE